MKTKAAIILTALLLIFLGFTSIKTNQQALLPAVPAIKHQAKPRAHKDPVLLGYASQLGLKIPTYMKLYLQTDMPGSNDTSADTTMAEYSSSDHAIYVKPGLGAEQTKQSLAYEYMHYVWESVATPMERGIIVAEATDLLRYSPTFQYYWSPFVGVNITLDQQRDEKDSIICTQMPATQLPLRINNYCNKYIPNRQKLLF